MIFSRSPRKRNINHPPWKTRAAEGYVLLSLHWPPCGFTFVVSFYTALFWLWFNRNLFRTNYKVPRRVQSLWNFLSPTWVTSSQKLYHGVPINLLYKMYFFYLTHIQLEISSKQSPWVVIVTCSKTKYTMWFRWDNIATALCLDLKLWINELQ